MFPHWAHIDCSEVGILIVREISFPSPSNKDIPIASIVAVAHLTIMNFLQLWKVTKKVHAVRDLVVSVCGSADSINDAEINTDDTAIRESLRLGYRKLVGSQYVEGLNQRKNFFEKEFVCRCDLHDIAKW